MFSKPAAVAQISPECKHDIENNPDAGKILRSEATVLLVRINDRIGRRKSRQRQMMVGYQNPDPELPGALHPVETGDPVINGDNEFRLLFLMNDGNNFL